MATIFCEFCGDVASTKVHAAGRLIAWTHNVARDVVRCFKHRRASKLHKSCRSHDPMTGRHRGKNAGRLWPQKGEDK